MKINPAVLDVGSRLLRICQISLFLQNLRHAPSAEAAVILAQAGLGISILPELFIPPDSTLSCILIRSVDPVSFGLYYKSTQGKAVLRDLLGILKSTLQRSKDRARFDSPFLPLCVVFFPVHRHFIRNLL